MTTRRLRHLASIRNSNVDKKSHENEQPVRLCNYTDVYYSDTIDEATPFMEATATPEEIRRFALRKSQVLMTKDSETADDIGIPAYVPHDMPDVVCGYHLTQLTPRWNIDGRFLFWCLRSRTLQAWFEVSARGVTRFALGQDAIGNAPIPFPSLPVQHRIADFLDRETERIDALIDKKRRLIDLLRERFTGIVELQIRALAQECGKMPLKFAVPEVTVGIVVTPARWYVETGVPAIRGTNVRPGRIDMSDLVYISAEGHTLHEKSTLREGDLVVVRTGQAGSAAIVPRELDGANCIDVLLIRRSMLLIPRYLEYVINSDWTRKYITAHSVGTIQSHFNVAALRELQIPVPTLTAQEAAIRHLDTEADRVERLDRALSWQVDLLAEYREALITAAVTGEIDVDTFDNDRHLEEATP